MVIEVQYKTKKMLIITKNMLYFYSTSCLYCAVKHHIDIATVAKKDI